MAPPLDALVGQVLDGHYRLDALLGAGGMGAVYKARHTSLKRDVAVKVLHSDIGSDPSISKRFDREAQSASRLDHPNCVRVTDFGSTAEGVKYLVMELLVGEELGARLGEPWDMEEACAVLDQILAGLEHAHHCGIVHRDLKPENVFLTHDFRGRELAKIVDFGIAKLLDDHGAAEVLTRAGMVFGTPRYMSPEQAAGGKVDARSDLYAVGILAHELLRGQPPFDSDDLASILRMQIMAPPPPLPSAVPGPLAAWVESLLEKSRHERPESASVARAQLDEIRGHLRERSATSAGADGQTDPPFDQLAATGEQFAATGELPATPAPQAPSPAPQAPSPQGAGPLPSKPEDMLGHTVDGRFELLALIGVGGMGAVFRAQDAHTGTTVAVKILHAALADDEELAARFEREAQTASELEHPNIVPVFTHGTTASTGSDALYLVMPLLEGMELRALIGAPVDPARAVHLMLQLFGALAHAHAHQVVHRDLKPENVFVIRDQAGVEHIQLVDFGLAKVAEAGSARRALTQFGQVFGTPAYMSPEQCRGEVVDARTDLYAAGVILYELLAGRAPFVADEPLELLRLQLGTEPPPLPPHVPPALRELVADLLVKTREHRVPDAPTAIAALEAAREAPVGLSSPRPPPTSLGGTMLPNVVPLAAGAGAQGPQASALSRVPRLWLYIGGGVLGLLILVALIPTGANEGEDEHSATNEPAAAASERPGSDPDRPKPSAEVYLDIDRRLSARDTDAALELVRRSRDQFPHDAGLLWREGRALALAGGETKRVTALHRYAEAVASDPSIANETDFDAELRELLRDKRLRTTAIDVAVRELGEIGHSFLLEVINDEDTELGYVERHRIIDELQHDPAMVARMDLRRHLSLDLRQAVDAPTSCTTFAGALDTIAAGDDPYFLSTLMSRSLEVPEDPGPGEDALACVGLDAKFEQVRGQLAADHPEAAAKAKTKGGGKKKKKGFRSLF